MNKHAFVRIALCISITLAALAWPALAGASGFQLVEQNASGLGNAFAGQAAGVKDASAVYFNPANLTLLPGTQVVLAVSPIGVETTFQDGGSRRPALGTTPIPVPLGGEGGDAGGWTPVPNGYVSWQAASKVWLGVGVNAPFGLKTEWEMDWMGRFKALESEVRTLNINPTVAVKLGDKVSLGAGANAQRLEATLSQGVPYGGLAYGGALQAAGPVAAAGILAQLGGPSGLALEGTSQVEGDAWSWGWNAGLSVQAGDRCRLAASYRSKVSHDLEGDVTFAGAPTFATSGPLGALGSALNARFASGPVVTNIELPDTASVAAAYEGGSFDVLADWTWTGWSSILTLAIARGDGTALSAVPLEFDDSWRAGLGVNYRMNESWMLRLGTAYDTTPVQDAFRTPRLPDEDRIWAALGVQLKVGKKGALDVGYAHLFVKDGTSSLPNQDTTTSPPSGTLVGTYAASVNLFGIQFRQSF